jgi:hypothetical protein
MHTSHTHGHHGREVKRQPPKPTSVQHAGSEDRSPIRRSSSTHSSSRSRPIASCTYFHSLVRHIFLRPSASRHCSVAINVFRPHGCGSRCRSESRNGGPPAPYSANASSFGGASAIRWGSVDPCMVAGTEIPCSVSKVGTTCATQATQPDSRQYIAGCDDAPNTRMMQALRPS